MDATRNEAQLVTHLTSAQSTVLKVDNWIGTHVGPFRDTTGVTLLDSTLTAISFPVSKDGKVIFKVNWVATQSATSGSPQLEVTAGGWRSDLGNYTFNLISGTTGSTAGAFKQWIVGPFESAQFGYAATSTAGGCFSTGETSIRFKIIGSSSGVALTTCHLHKVGILPFNLPDVSYDT